MKTFSLAILLLILICTPAMAKSYWTINGIPLSEFQDITWKKAGALGAGAVISALTHATSHILYLEILGRSWHIDGLMEVCDGRLSDSQAAMFGRAGFIGALSVGTLGKIFGKKKSYFWTGFHFMTFIETSTYPIRWKDEGDLELIDRSSNSEIEWAIYTTWSSILLDLHKQK